MMAFGCWVTLCGPVRAIYPTKVVWLVLPLHATFLIEGGMLLAASCVQLYCRPNGLAIMAGGFMMGS